MANSNDDRFSSISSDPRFRRLKHDQRKVKIDSRFKSMFKDKKFKLKYSVDKRGRPVNTTTNENLRKYYALSDDDSDSEAEKDSKVSRKTETRFSDKVGTQKIKATKEQPKETLSKSDDEEHSSGDEESSSGDEEPSSVDDDEQLSTGDCLATIDYARGEGLSSDSSTSDEDDDDDDVTEEVVEHDWGELDRDAPKTTEITRRLAACNMDWDNVKAVDLLMLFNSFKTGSGVIRSVTIYPSDYGLERMKVETANGPTELVDGRLKEKLKTSRTCQTDEEYQREILRQYELNRLKYYYAVVDCDSVETASNIYDECNGKEYETSGLIVDLRFIPDEMTFDNQAKDVAASLPDTSSYKPNIYANTALQNSNVELSWDKTPNDRLAVTSRKYTAEELEAADLRAYLASDSDEDESEAENLKMTSSSVKKNSAEGDEDSGNDSEKEEEEDEERSINKYRQLINGLTQNEPNKSDQDMEFTWELGVKSATEKLMRKKSHEEDNTPWGKYLEKRREKKRQRRDEKRKKKRSASGEGGSSDAESDDSLPAGIDLNDEYFAEELRATEEDFGSVKTKIKKGRKNKKKSVAESLSTYNEDESKRQEAELALLVMDAKGDTKNNTKDGKTKKKRRKEKLHEDEDSRQTIEDPRFKDIYTNPLFNVDPSAPEFKKRRKH